MLARAEVKPCESGSLQLAVAPIIKEGIANRRRCSLVLLSESPYLNLVRVDDSPASLLVQLTSLSLIVSPCRNYRQYRSYLRNQCPASTIFIKSCYPLYGINKHYMHSCIFDLTHFVCYNGGSIGHALASSSKALAFSQALFASYCLGTSHCMQRQTIVAPVVDDES